MGWFGKKRDSATPAAEPLSVYEQYNEESVNTMSQAPTTRSNYVAPVTVQPQELESTPSSRDFTDDMVLISNADDDDEDTFGGVDENTSSFARNTAEEADHVTYGGASMGSYVHSLFNGHLMKWKFEAEEGTCSIRVPACMLFSFFFC